MKRALGSTVLAAMAWSCSPAATRAPSRDGERTPPPVASASTTLDDFEDISPWEEVVSTGVHARVFSTPGVQGKALGLEFDFAGHGGYAAVRRKRAVELPENYELSFDIRGDAKSNDLQVKLLDESGDNVWWYRLPNFEFGAEPRRVRVKKRQIEFAWGPTKDRALHRAAGLEFVVAAGEGGRGTIAIDNLTLTAVPVPPAVPPRPVARASRSAPSAGPELAVDGRADTAWRSAEGEKQAELDLDFGYVREFGGLVLTWAPGAHASRYDVELSEDGTAWRLARRVTSSDGERDALFLPESEARFVRLRLHEGPGGHYALREAEVQPIAFGATLNAFISAVARTSPRGQYPRGYLGEQSYWTLVAVDGASDSGLVSEDGAVELGRGDFSIEPFVVRGGKVASWADVTVSQSLRDGYLPLPSVRWQHPEWELEVSPFALGEPARSELATRYALRNVTDRALELQLVLAVRPFQVNPPTQSLNRPGGVSPIHSLGWDGRKLTINGERSVLPVTPPSHVGLQSFDGGGFPDRPPPSGGTEPATLADDTGLASAALVYHLSLPPRGRAEVALAGPLGNGAPSLATSLPAIARENERSAAFWREALNRVSIRVPAAGQPWIDTLRSSLAHMLMSREGPILRPGTRSYARSWIRDGAMMSESLLRLGHTAAAVDYLTWYAPYQFENGKVPCCVDARGADPVPENDSPGEFIFLAAEIYRFTRDRALLEKVWPNVHAAARYLDALRRSERTEANLTPERRAFYGLLPPSISHEGYSEKPAYSYWDDFWGLIGFQDAVYLAEARGDAAALAALTPARDEFRNDLYASLRESTARYRIPYLPGAADRGDFDPTSTTIALAPGHEGPFLPRDLLLATFERYYREFVTRRDGKASWDVYTPYELRSVGTFVRLGWRDRAEELLEFFMRDRRPSAWNQWAEVVGREPRSPRFIGDMPHAWISSDYIRSILDLFAYERHAERALVLAAGVPRTYWTGDGVDVRDLRTVYGPVSYSIRPRGDRVLVEVRGSAPPGGFVLPWPWSGAPTRATVNGRPEKWHEGELRFRDVPARITLEPPRTGGGSSGRSGPNP